MPSNVLIVDDEPELARSLSAALQRRLIDKDADECSFILSHTENDALEAFSLHKPEVVILDLTIDIDQGPESGLSLLDQFHRKDPSSRILVLTSHSASKFGINALQRGALSFHEKPGDPDLLLSLVLDGINVCKLKRTHEEIKKELDTGRKSLTLIGGEKSLVMKSIADEIDFSASHSQPTLLTGETGTGKGFIARIIHSLGKRNKKPFIRYQPNFANPDLVASELFGHARGAFTGANDDKKGLIAESDGGTLFIDEIDSIPKEVQVILLEVIQEKTFRRVGSSRLEKSDFRLISATNKIPENLLKDETLRLDFYHRIAHFRIDLPPLRSRKEDIPSLALKFLENIVDRENLEVIRFEDAAIRQLIEYAWPGNIRELQAVVEGAAFRASYRGNRSIELQDIKIKDQNISDNKSTTTNRTSGDFRSMVKSYEEELVKKALSENNGNQAQASKALQMDRTVLRRILERSENKTD
ncbi:MAG TPA: sigma-54 dependent transcriptional regulator [Oligoflexia bacterium]|nr:sigma-54 dependent transcriptional regulator [Oligoflexia bacterium]HMP49585.1 sigma-54 dependent transcriptional regulator [Oligoflexia bacterium]